VNLISEIPIYLKEGSILPLSSSSIARHNFTLIVALDTKLQANGYLIYDDGREINIDVYVQQDLIKVLF
jgi:hypothetical protein